MKNFFTNFIQEFIKLNAHSLSNYPGMVFLFYIFTLFDTASSHINAKAYFLLGYCVIGIIFYTLTNLMYPQVESKISRLDYSESININLNELNVPFENTTFASFNLFIFGYTITYWINLNLLQSSENVEILIAYNLIAIFIFSFFNIYYLNQSSLSVILSLCTGIISGLIWSQLIFHESSFPSNFAENKFTDDKFSSMNNEEIHKCNGSSSDNKICKAYRY